MADVDRKVEQLSFIALDTIFNIITIKAEYRVNKKERPMIRTRA